MTMIGDPRNIAYSRGRATKRQWLTPLLLAMALIGFGQRIAMAQTGPEEGDPGPPLLVQIPAQIDSLPVPTVQPLRWHSMITNIPHDWARFAELTFRPENIPAAVAMVGLTGLLIATDDASWQWSHRQYAGSPPVKSASDIFVFLGDGRPQFGVAAAFGLFGVVAGDERALTTASQTVEVILACGVIVQVLKHITGRQSPFVATRPGGVWDFFPNQIEYHKNVPHFDAYPSGHIATTMATVTVIAENYPECWWIRPVGYAAVAALGVSMVNTGIHWYSDYPLGLFLGYTFGMIVSHPEGVGGGAREDGLTLSPMILPDGGGLSLTLRI